MNAAFTARWSELTGNEQVVLPYKTLGHIEKGEKLPKLLTEIPDDAPDRYPRAIDSWAVELDMKGWYSWNLRKA